MRNRSWWRFLAVLLLLAQPAVAQDPRSAVLRPPKGAEVAIVVFEDLQCPDCSRAAPLLLEASKTYKIPKLRYDFPLPRHLWAREAAIYAKFFDDKPEALGDDFRDYIFSNQPAITKDNLRSYAEKFAAEHKLALPFAVDPTGELEKKVQPRHRRGQERGRAAHSHDLRGQRRTRRHALRRGGGPQPALPDDRGDEAAGGLVAGAVAVA